MLEDCPPIWRGSPLACQRDDIWLLHSIAEQNEPLSLSILLVGFQTIIFEGVNFGFDHSSSIVWTFMKSVAALS